MDTPFKLEQFFEKYEFNTPYLLCTSDNESHSLNELLAMADPASKKLWEDLSLGYTQVYGDPLLRNEISGLYTNVKDTGVGTFAGAGEALYCAIQSIVKPGDHVIAPYPCYQTLASLPKELGAEVSQFPIHEKEGGWFFDINDLCKLLRKNTRLILINFPHNPTSAHIDNETLEKIIDVAKSSNAYLISDEVYRFSERPPHKPLTPAADLYENALSIGVMSKTFGLAGLRIGWIATQNKSLLAKVMNLKKFLSLCNSGPSEILSIIALRARDKILSRNLQIISNNLALLDAFFQKYSHLFVWKRPQAGSTAFVKCLIPRPMNELVEDIIAKVGVLLLPGNIYDYADSYFRLGFGRKNMPEALTHLEKYIHENYS